MNRKRVCRLHILPVDYDHGSMESRCLQPTINSRATHPGRFRFTQCPSIEHKNHQKARDVQEDIGGLNTISGALNRLDTALRGGQAAINYNPLIRLAISGTERIFLCTLQNILNQT